MAGNTFGNLFRLTTFGESHGKAIGGVIDGCPSGLEISLDLVEKEMARRKPGQSEFTTARKEADQVEWLSGIFENKTTGSPIGFLIHNTNQKSKDYSKLKDVYRPSHADFVYQEKYGHRDYRGGGRASARETAVRVAGGGIAKQFLAIQKIEVRAFVTSIADIDAEIPSEAFSESHVENELRCPDVAATEKMKSAILEAKEQGDSLGGVITCVVRNVPVGLGEPVFDKLHADLAKAMMGIHATRGFEIGSGFASARMRGSQHNDAFETKEGKVVTQTNHSGGIQGGISNGMDIVFRVAFKPVASISKEQKTVNRDGEEVSIEIEGRHDPCVIPRAVPIVEAMTALVLADHSLRNRTTRI